MDRTFLDTPVALRWISLANIVANIGIVITGGAVRLTGSGLGCPTWPSCTNDSYVTTSAMGSHGVIEFGNRMLTFVVVLIAVLGVVSAWAQRPRRRRTVLLAFGVAAGIPLQAVVGGITVLTGLNPWVVAYHFLVSMPLIAVAYLFWRSTGPATDTAAGPPALRALAATTLAACAAVLVLGAVVTGSGPHAGDAAAARTGFDPRAVAQLHADGVFLLVGLSVGLWLATRAAGLPARAALTLLAVELAQGAIGLVQYLTGIPAVLVAAHMAGACAVWLATLVGYAAVAGRRAVAEPPPGPEPVLPDALVLPHRSPVGGAPDGTQPEQLLGLGRAGS